MSGRDTYEEKERVWFRGRGLRFSRVGLAHADLLPHVRQVVLILWDPITQQPRSPSCTPSQAVTFSAMQEYQKAGGSRAECHAESGTASAGFRLALPDWC